MLLLVGWFVTLVDVAVRRIQRVPVDSHCGGCRVVVSWLVLEFDDSELFVVVLSSCRRRTVFSKYCPKSDSSDDESPLRG